MKPQKQPAAARPPDLYQSLQQLEGKDWGEPDFHSHLVTERHRLHRVPLRNFTVENLRIMIGQSLGLKYLVPLALARLESDPFAEGDFYPCDLLVSMLRAEARFWQEHPQMKKQITSIVERAIALFPTVPDIASETVTRAVNVAHEEFKKEQEV